MGYSENMAVQQQQLYKAYEKTPVQTKSIVEKVETKEEVQVDIYDKIYVGLRAFVPDWLLLTFILVGAITIGTLTFKKQIRFLLQLWSRTIKS